MNSRCIYYVEGKCEEQLINALKQQDPKLIPGKVKVFNIIPNIIPKSHLLAIQPGTIVALAFDTDKPVTEYLRKNIMNLRKYCVKVKIIYLAQVLDFEDEMERATDVKKAQELTKSQSVSNFKSDFCRMKVLECRKMLERHHIKPEILWTTDVPDEFDFVEKNSNYIKLT